MIISRPRPELDRFVVTAEQMQQIESRGFEAGMPVAALMEKVAQQLTSIIQQELFAAAEAPQCWGVLAGPGHNGGDALVVARELHLRGYGVQVYQPLDKAKDLTEAHARYARSLGISFVESIDDLTACDGIIDGLFGFGLTRPLEGALAAAVEAVNSWDCPVVSIDLPSGIHTDTGAVLGSAVRATHTLCLGLWKRACYQEPALPYLGRLRLVDFDLPLADIQAVLGSEPAVSRLTAATALACLPLPRSPAAHKYKAGELLVIAGSRDYSGAAILAGLGARSSGIGMLTLVVPQTLKPLIHPILPEALVMGCEETEEGAIARLPEDLDLSRYSAVACGPGLTRAAADVVRSVLKAAVPLVLDADGLNSLADPIGVEALTQRPAPTVLTPHPGEFKRLFPNIWEQTEDAGAAAIAAAESSGAVVLLKGPRSAIASPRSRLWYLPDSTPALARGGSGDVLTGLLGGLLAQTEATGDDQPAIAAALGAVWWHAQAGLLAATDCTELGVDPQTLTQYLAPALRSLIEPQ